MILIETKDRIAYITLNRPDKKNALNSELVKSLKVEITKAANNDAIKVIILKGAGTTFCAGADLEYLQQLQKNSYEDNLADSNSLKELFELIYFLPKIVIAQVEGHAIAGGCGLANVCDFTFSVPEAKFGYTEVKIGFIPAIVMTFLIRKIGEQKARELLLSGNLIDVNEALKINLVTKTFDKETIENEVFNFANKLCLENSGSSMAQTKLMIANIQTMPILEALNYASTENAKARNSEDCKKGINAFINKIKLLW